ncbi:Hpt domain-containing protein [Kriegella sp. EG-1]|nr:Hpt domain-containing protein [Flavobacteriaceae bacterium EG-1]
MEDTVKYIEEFPNMDYVIHLGGTDFDFERKFIAILKKEFTWQLGNYLYHIKKDEPRAAAEVVHKIKFKFSVLGMNHAFTFSEYYEEQLHVGNMALDEDFKKCLRKVNEFLKTLEE